MKPVVKYNINKHSFIKVGSRAIVHPIDHPSKLVSNTKAVATSIVIKVNGANFETENTKYRGVRV